ncbi:MAG: thioredoxin domain-containing protein [Aquihabitans sp.]
MTKPSGRRGWFRRGRDATGDFAGASETSGADARLTAERSSDPSESAEPNHVEITELDDVSFDTGTEGGATIVDFWAAWCGPCTMFHPMFQHAADSHDGPVRFARCDIESSPRTAAMMGIQSIPTVALFDVDGNEVERLTGVPSGNDLSRLIASAVALVATP